MSWQGRLRFIRKEITVRQRLTGGNFNINVLNKCSMQQ